MTSVDPLQVEASRRLLRAILNRREFVTAVGIGALGLAGCGSGNSTTGSVPPPPPPPPPPPGTIPTGFTSVTGLVSLPSGSTLKLADLTVDVLTQTVPVNSSAAFTVGITSDGPALALLLDASDNGVLMSLFDSGQTSYAISSHTTAVALLYYATGATYLPAAAMSQVLALLDADPGVAAVSAAVAQAVAGDPHAVANGAATISTAITQALQTIVGSSLREASGKSVAVAPQLLDGAPTLITLNSIAEQNGVVVSLDPATVSVLVSNAKRRPCKVYVYEVTTQTGNTITDVLPAALVQGPFNLDSTQNLGVFNGLKAIAHGLNGAAPWTPVNLPPIPLILTPSTADKTVFQMIVLSSSARWPSLDAAEPPFFRDVHFANEVAKWRADTQALFAITVLADLVLPFLCFLGGVGAVYNARSAVTLEVTSAKVLGSATFREIIATLQFGSLGELEAGLAEVVQNAVNSELTGNLPDFWLPEVKAVVSDARAAALSVQNAPTFGSRLAKGAKMFSKLFEPLALAGLVLDGLDFGKVLKDFFESDVGAEWEIDLNRQKLGLLPQNPRVVAGDADPVHFTVSLPVNLPAGSYEYDWTQSSLFATLSGVGEANAGNSITTSKLAVDLRTTGSDALHPITVLVIGYDKSSGQRVEIGRAGTVVNFLYPAQMIPTSPPVMDRGDQRLYSVDVDGVLPNGVLYKWTLTGASGTIGSSNVVTTSVPQISYTAGGGGIDTLHVDVVAAAGTLYAKADASIVTAAPSSIQFDVTGPWDPTQTPPTGHYVFPAVVGARVLDGSNSGLDGLALGYDQGAGEQLDSGVLLILYVPAGAVITQGETWAKVNTGDPVVSGKFAMLLASNLSNPNSPQYEPAATGTCRLNVLNRFLSGVYYAEYSFSLDNGVGGKIIGSGVARWT